MSTYYLQLLSLIAINCLLGLAAGLPLSGGLLVVCCGAFFGVGALVAAYLHATLAVPFILALLGGALCAALSALVASLLATRARGFLFAIATLSLGEVLRVIVLNSAALGGALGYKDVLPVVGPGYPLVSLLLVFVLLRSLMASPVGSALLAVRVDERWSLQMGIRPELHRGLAMALGGFIAGLAGGLYVHNVGILEPRMFGAAKSIEILLFPIIGGVTRVWGPVAGAVILTLVPEIFRFSASWRMVLYGCSMVLVTLFWRDGISGLADRLSRSVPMRARSKDATV